MTLFVRDAASLSPDDNLGPAVLESIWIEMVVATIILAARFYTRAHLLRKVALDDWAMLFSYLLTLVGTIFYTIAVHHGVGRHEKFLDDASGSAAFKWDLLGQVVGILSSTFARLAFVMMIFAIISTQQRIQWIVLWSVVVSQLLLNISLVIFILVQCRPTALLWDHSMQGTCLPPENQEHFGFVQGGKFKQRDRWSAINSLTDLILAIFPATIFWNLNMKLAVKLSLCVTMGLGIFAMVASIVKTVYLKSIAEVNDYTYETSFLIIWFSLEQYIIIIAASIPTLKPLLSRERFRRTYDSNKNMQSGGTTASRRQRRRTLPSNIESDRIELTNRYEDNGSERFNDSSLMETAGPRDHKALSNPALGEGDNDGDRIMKTVHLEVSYQGLAR